MSDITIPCVLFRISKTWYGGISEDDLYDVTHGWWHMGPKREQAQYALAVAKGIVRGVYEVDSWRPRYFDDTATHPARTRWGFDGRPAADQEHLIGVDVKHLFPKGAATPFKYLNLGGLPAPRAPIADAAPAGAISRTRGLRRVCDSLAANPVLHLSLGSKELFHSNFLAWLFQINVDIAREALAPWSEADYTQEKHDVRRECQSLDLIVNVPGAKPVVIENKVFSIPDKAQLDRYGRRNIPAVPLHQSTNLLLSLSDPKWVDDRYRGWTWVSYPDLSRRVETSVRNHVRGDPFIVRLVEYWVAMVADLQTIVDFVQPNDWDECLLLDADVVELLRSVRLHDAYQKFRTAAVRHRLEQLFAEVGLRFDHVESAFSHASPLLGAAVDLPDGSRVGWQLQGKQWRRYVVVPESYQGKGDSAKQGRISYVQRAHPTWFSFSKEQLLGPFDSAPSRALKHFAPDFVYDYISAPGLSVQQVLDLGETTLRAANEYRAAFSGQA